MVAAVEGDGPDLVAVIPERQPSRRPPLGVAWSPGRHRLSRTEPAPPATIRRVGVLYAWCPRCRRAFTLAEPELSARAAHAAAKGRRVKWVKAPDRYEPDPAPDDL
jgi:hypothetical protein